MTIRWDEITYDNLTNIEKALNIYDQAFPIDVRESHNIFLKVYSMQKAGSQIVFGSWLVLKEGSLSRLQQGTI